MMLSVGVFAVECSGLRFGTVCLPAHYAALPTRSYALPLVIARFILADGLHHHCSAMRYCWCDVDVDVDVDAYAYNAGEAHLS
mgnify:CR=1 FL=1